MANKKLISALVAAAAIGSAAGLASCDVDVSLKESEKNQKILDINGLTNNTLEYIYDALVKSGDSNSEKILNSILLKLAEDQFGSFYDLKDVVANNGYEAFIAAHKSVYGNVTGEAAKSKVNYIYNTILEKIQKSFWEIANNSAYKERSVFYEEKFYMNTISDMYELGTVTSFVEKQDLGSDTYRDVDSYFSANWLVTYKDYIVKNVLPSIMRKLLVTEYLYNKNYGTLGRSYARKVSYISLPQNSDYKDKVLRLAKEWTKACLAVNSGVDGAGDLNFLDELYKGYFNWDGMDADKKTLVEDIYAAAGFTVVTPGAADKWVKHYRETLYGDKIFDFKKITDNRFSNDSSVYSTFTGSGAYTTEVGLKIQTNEIIAKGEVKEGWFTSSGLSDIPSAAKTNLFKISVANELDHKDAVTDNKDGDYTTYLPGQGYFLNKSTSDKKDSDDIPYVINDIDSGTTYIVKVEEAVNNSKLMDNQQESSYNKIHADDPIFREKIAREVAYILADNETYKKAANQYYIEQAALNYHDDTVYYYFEATFPDLFD